MTTFLRRAGLLTLSLLVMAFSIAGAAVAQDEGASCYPVPPGGCEPEEITPDAQTEEPEAEPTPEPTEEPEEEAEEEPEEEVAVLAETGTGAGPMALIALAGLLAGFALVKVSRRA